MTEGRLRYGLSNRQLVSTLCLLLKYQSVTADMMWKWFTSTVSKNARRDEIYLLGRKVGRVRRGNCIAQNYISQQADSLYSVPLKSSKLTDQ